MTDLELDGLACVRCHVEFQAGAASVPAGFGPRGQIFTCTDCESKT